MGLEFRVWGLGMGEIWGLETDQLAELLLIWHHARLFDLGQGAEHAKVDWSRLRLAGKQIPEYLRRQDSSAASENEPAYFLQIS